MNRANENWAHLKKNKVLEKIKISKNCINKGWTPYQIFFIEKNWKDPTNF